MPAPTRAFVRVIEAFALVAALGLAANASAQTLRKPARMAHPAPKALPMAPGVELQTSTSAAVGSENHYYSDTVGSSYTDLTDQSFRYGQSPSPRYENGEPLFRF
jgi:hypothetical protein